MIAEPMTEDMRATARTLADAAREAEPAITKILLFPSAVDVRLVYVDTTARPAGDEARVVPYYFRPSPTNGINHESAVALIRPEEEGNLALPNGWGTWRDAETFWEQD